MRRMFFIGIIFIVLTSTALALKEADPVKTKVHSTRTKDGWELSITRFFTEDKPFQKKKAAVILCHGFNINDRFWDLDKRSSLARFLAKNGYDVWTPSLRGSGQSSKPLLSNLRSMVKFDLANLPRLFLKAPFDIAKFDWTIDDHIHKDVPAIIDLVRKESGFNDVFWVGHSMGGIIMYGYLETETRDEIAGFIPIGSMMVIPQPLSPYLETISNQKPLMTASLLINTTVASQLRNITLGILKNPIEDLLIKRENMHNDVIFRFFRVAIDDTSSGVVSQFSNSLKAGSIMSSDTGYNYTNNLHLVKVPILVIGGGADGFVTEKSLRDSLEAVSSKDKQITMFSEAYGYSTDYGHCDLLLGKNSEKEVYPVILNWLDERITYKGQSP